MAVDLWLLERLEMVKCFAWDISNEVTADQKLVLLRKNNTESFGRLVYLPPNSIRLTQEFVSAGVPTLNSSRR
jgi:hypothetical protein